LVSCISSQCREACLIFKAGKNCDSYSIVDDLLAQVDKAIDIFEECTNGFATGYFFLTLLQAIKNALQMQPQPAGCLDRMDGHTAKMASACDQLSFQIGKLLP